MRRPAAIPVLPDWSPVAKFGGYALPTGCDVVFARVLWWRCARAQDTTRILLVQPPTSILRQLAAGAWQNMGLWGSGCDCFVF